MPYKKVDITGEGTEVVDGGRGTPVDVVQEPTNELEKANTRFISSDKAPQKTVVDSDLQVLGKYYDKDGNEIGGGSGTSVIEVSNIANIPSEIVETLKAGDIVVQNNDGVKTSYIVSTDDPDDNTKVLTRYDGDNVFSVIYTKYEEGGVEFWEWDDTFTTPIVESQEICSKLQYRFRNGTRSVFFPKYILPVAFITDSGKYYKCNYRTLKAIDEQSNQINLEFDSQNRVVANAISSINNDTLVSVSYCKVDSTEEQWISNADFTDKNFLTNPVNEDLVIGVKSGGTSTVFSWNKIKFENHEGARGFQVETSYDGDYAEEMVVELTGGDSESDGRIINWLRVLNNGAVVCNGGFWRQIEKFTPATTGTITKHDADTYVQKIQSGQMCIRNFENFHVSYYNPNETTFNYSYLSLVSIIDGGGLLTRTIINYKIDSSGKLTVSLSTY